VRRKQPENDVPKKKKERKMKRKEEAPEGRKRQNK